MSDLTRSPELIHEDNGMSKFYLQLFEPQSRPQKSSVFLVSEKLESKPEKKDMLKLNCEQDDLFIPLRVFLRFGRLIGVVPLLGILGRDSKTLRFRWSTIPALSSIIAILILSTNVVVGIISFFQARKRTASDVAYSSAMAIFYATGLFVYTYFILNANTFIELFEKWRTLKPLHFKDSIGDLRLFYHANLVAGLILASGILENLLLFHLQSNVIPNPSLAMVPAAMNGTFWEVYYRKSHTEWVRLYNESEGAPFLGVFVFVANKLALYSWNFADILITLFSRALYFKFKRLNEVAEERLMTRFVASNDKHEWAELTRDHKTLCDLLAEFEKFLSPLIFGCYASNIFFICLQVKMGITPPAEETHLVQAVYTVWSFLHLIVRIFIESVSAAKINDHAHATRQLLQMCSPQAYSLEVQRLEQLLGTSVIGLNGLRCFILTKPFLLTIVGVVFTIEIVLLQAP